MGDIALNLVYIVVALIVPILLAGRPEANGFRGRYVIAVVAAILAGIFVARVTQVLVIWQSGSPGSMAMQDALSAFAFAAASGTLLYSLGTLFFGSRSEVRRT